MFGCDLRFGEQFCKGFWNDLFLACTGLAAPCPVEIVFAASLRCFRVVLKVSVANLRFESWGRGLIAGWGVSQIVKSCPPRTFALLGFCFIELGTAFFATSEEGFFLAKHCASVSSWTRSNPRRLRSTLRVALEIVAVDLMSSFTFFNGASMLGVATVIVEGIVFLQLQIRSKD